MCEHLGLPLCLSLGREWAKKEHTHSVPQSSCGWSQDLRRGVAVVSPALVSFRGHGSRVSGSSPATIAVPAMNTSSCSLACALASKAGQEPPTHPLPHHPPAWLSLLQAKGNMPQKAGRLAHLLLIACSLCSRRRLYWEFSWNTWL